MPDFRLRPIARVRHAALPALCALGLLAGLAGCEDAPTAPRAYVHPAEGEVWVAITVPPGIPDLETWKPFLREAGSKGAAGYARMRELHSEAERARHAGDLEQAFHFEEAAAREASLSLASVSDPRVFARAFTALDSWLDRAETQFLEVPLPQLEMAVRSVRADRRAAERALVEGDTAAAVLHVATASLHVREQAPLAVALRVIDRATHRLAAHHIDDENAARARRLLANAREALLERQDARALQRALYALQIADGQVSSAAADTLKAACEQGSEGCAVP